MKNAIDTNFAFAILILVASLLGFVFWLDYENGKLEEITKEIRIKPAHPMQEEKVHEILVVDKDVTITDFIVSENKIIYFLGNCHEGSKCSVVMYDAGTDQNSILIENMQDIIPLESYLMGWLKLMNYDEETRTLRILNLPGAPGGSTHVSDIDVSSGEVVEVDSVEGLWCDPIAETNGMYGVLCNEEQLRDLEKEKQWSQIGKKCLNAHDNDAIKELTANELLLQKIGNEALYNCIGKRS